MASIEERFQAAVNVIKGLPKNGPYQPSTAMMLRFYGYYKQATEGPCNHKKPAFWDIVGKAKWDAWNENKQLTKHQAMQKYVENLREIIETMSFTENVQNFVGSLNELEINLNDLEAIVPGMRQIAENHPDSPFRSRSQSPQHDNAQTSSDESIDVIESANNITLNGHEATSNSSTAISAILSSNDHETNAPSSPIVTKNPASVISHLVEQSDDEYGDPYDYHENLSLQMQKLHEVNATVQMINADLVVLNRRSTEMETTLRELRAQVQLLGKMNKSKKTANWWPLADISPAWFALLILWPFCLKYVRRLLLLPTSTRHKR